MKYGNSFYLELNRDIFTNDCTLSKNARYLFCVLKECEARYTGEQKDYFWTTDEKLMKLSLMSERVIRDAKNELINGGYIERWYSHFIHKDGSKSEKRVSVYRILIH